MLDRYEKLNELIKRYHQNKKNANLSNISEEAIRVWLNDMLFIFGWDVRSTSQIIQEKPIKNTQKDKLSEINSTHIKPDYTLVNGNIVKSYLDAKNITVDIFTNKEAAFQIRSYGWSAGVPCAFLSNFEQFVIYDCKEAPKKDMPANVGAIQLRIDEYLDNFEVLNTHLDRMAVYNNQLETLYSQHRNEGQNTVDIYFNQFLTDFRVKLANELYARNKYLSEEQLNYYVQIIINRIIFIRVCESKQIEQKEILKEFVKEGFWEKFKINCYKEFYTHYDGAMFSDFDEDFLRLDMDNDIFEQFVERLYYPYPYKFDAIPVHVIARVYESFLSYLLVIKEHSVYSVLKEEYVKTKGTIPTEQKIAEAVCSETLDLDKIVQIDDLFRVKVLDPCCGSGIFLVTVYEKLADRLKQLAGRENRDYCIEGQGKLYLTVSAKQKIMQNCLYGLDLDRTAVDVTKMSLALKLIDDSAPFLYSEIGIWGEKILQNIDKNIECGNTLVDADISVSSAEIPDIRPVNVRKLFKEVFDKYGGFTYIVGNPPYVETKYYKASSLSMHKYLKNKYSSFEGKADLAVLFVERCLQLMKANGRAGLIIQRRWFKTSYGKKAREMISGEKYLKKLIDISTNNLFPGRTTYVSILVLEKQECNHVEYDYISGNRYDVINYFEEKNIRQEIPASYFCEPIWAPEFYRISEIKKKYAGIWGTVKDNPGIYIRDGIQALWKKVYHITKYTLNDDVIYGMNGFGEKVEIESEIVKPVIYNHMFLPLKRLSADAYCIFPYSGKRHKDKMSMEELSIKYPKAYAYLLHNEERIKENVRCNEGEYWHTFTREHNHEWFESKKIIIPMTAKDVTATYERDNGFYMDNSNVWFVNLDSEDEILFKALTMIFNSTLFSVLAKSGAIALQGGYYKFNKQYLNPVPLPNENLVSGNSKMKGLAKYYEELIELRKEYDKAEWQNKIYFKSVMEHKWEEVDRLCNEFYELDEKDWFEIKKVGRVVDRITGKEG